MAKRSTATMQYNKTDSDETTRLVDHGGSVISVVGQQDNNGREVRSGQEQNQRDQDDEQQLQRIARLENKLKVLKMSQSNTNLRLCVAIGTVTVITLVVAGLGLFSVYQLTYDKTAQTIEQSKHTTYTLIGKFDCLDGPQGTSTVYNGITVGLKSDTGSINYQCMPTENQEVLYHNDSYYGNTPITFSNMVRYNTFHSEEYNNTVVYCALCRIDGRDTIQIQPATYNCSEGWTKEYEGYLMSGGLCVHTDMLGDSEIETRINDLYLQHEVMINNKLNTKFVNNQVLSCAVCSI